MKRYRSAALTAWLGRKGRKPLVLRGARQTGKTWLVRAWAADRDLSLVELNLERDPAAAACFVDNDAIATLRRIEGFTGRHLLGARPALLFLDEIQAAPQVLAKLRWLAEEQPALPVIAAGSLLDFTLAAPPHGVPVGRIGYLHLEPLGFQEFLEAMGEDVLAEHLATTVTASAIIAGDASPPPLHDRLRALFREYVLVGGMPAAVDRYRSERSFAAVAEVHDDLLATLRDDFGKYADRVHHRRLTAILAAVPRQLGQRFRFRDADRDERAAALGQAVDLLCLARVCHRVHRSAATGVPLAADADAGGFKLLHLDVGLACAALGLTPTELDRTPELVMTNEGGVAEQVAGQLLRLGFPAQREPTLHYWQRDERGAEAELDYVIQQGARMIPVEIKAGTTGSLKSLHLFMARRRLRLAVRCNSDRPSVTDVTVKTTTGAQASYRLLSLPLYLVEQLPRLLDELT